VFIVIQKPNSNKVFLSYSYLILTSYDIRYGVILGFISSTNQSAMSLRNL